MPEYVDGPEYRLSRWMLTLDQPLIDGAHNLIQRQRYARTRQALELDTMLAKVNAEGALLDSARSEAMATRADAILSRMIAHRASAQFDAAPNALAHRRGVFTPRHERSDRGVDGAERIGQPPLRRPPKSPRGRQPSDILIELANKRFGKEAGSVAMPAAEPARTAAAGFSHSAAPGITAISTAPDDVRSFHSAVEALVSSQIRAHGSSGSRPAGPSLLSEELRRVLHLTHTHLPQPPKSLPSTRFGAEAAATAATAAETRTCARPLRTPPVQRR